MTLPLQYRLVSSGDLLYFFCVVVEKLSLDNLLAHYKRHFEISTFYPAAYFDLLCM